NYNLLAIKSPVVIGSFAPGAASATQNVVFSNTGEAAGTVRRNGFPINAGFVAVFNSQGSGNFGSYTISANGNYVVPVLAPENYLIRAADPVPQGGTSLFGISAPTIVVGQTISSDVDIQPTGTVTGTVLTGGGAPAVGVQVNLT